MGKRIVLIDAITVIKGDLDKVFSEVIPDAEVIHIVDEGILKCDIGTKKITKRFCKLAVLAEDIDADAILITCAHGINVLDTVQAIVKPPVLQITLPMIEAAVSRAETIGLVATEEAIVKPITELLESAAKKMNKKIKVTVGLCREAFKARLAGNTDKSDELLIETIRTVAEKVDVVVLAQVSSCRIVPKAQQQTTKPILSPIVIAAERIKGLLDLT